MEVSEPKIQNNILITGASGLVARFIAEKLSQNNCNEIYMVSSRDEIIRKRYNGKQNIHPLPIREALAMEYDGKPYTVIHCAFTRKNDGQSVVSSLNYTEKILMLCRKIQARTVINMSSRSVYIEPEEGHLNFEESPIAGNGAIGLGKYAAELLTHAFFAYNSSTKYTNLRLASVNELKTDSMMVRPLNVFVDSVIQQHDIHVVGGMQVMSYIDPRDIADAVNALLDSKCRAWQPVYNLGTGWLCTDKLINMARLVVNIGKEFGFNEVEIKVEEAQVDKHAGLDISKITADTGWIPRITLDEMIRSLYKMKLEATNEEG